ncbi:MAG: DUF445 domain-containing protein [Chitinophagaceae bacterium]
MMNWWLILIPFVGALIGWLVNTLAIKVLLRPGKRQAQLAKEAGKLVNTELFSFRDLEEKITSPENVQKIMPLAEAHIDSFLRTRLSEAFPMISMFIGDSTINQLKSIFMKELETIFPELMKGYIQNLQQQLDMEQVVTQKLASIPPEKFENHLRVAVSRELRLMKILGAVTGFVAGLIQTAIIMLTN